MKNIFLIIVLFCATSVFGQTKDRRAELDVVGRINEISVSPDGKIWLTTAVGKTYYCNHIDSVWHYGTPLYFSSDLFFDYGPDLDRITFFNKDTAILTGYISFDKERIIKDGYYLTKDGGQTWELRNYGGDSWIYSIHNDQKGNAWMGGKNKELYFSNDFGMTWKTKKLPYKYSDRTYGIFMSDPLNGIASSDNNEILITDNNWKSAKKIITPLDQKKCKEDVPLGHVDSRISKIVIWKNYIVVNQSSQIFYTEKNLIDWKVFPVKIVDFELDVESQLLYVVSDSLNVFSFSDPEHFQLIKDEKLLDYPLNMKVSNGSLYIITYDKHIYKINKKEMKSTLLFTTDHSIPDPSFIVRGKKLAWGANGDPKGWGINGKHLYILDYNELDWYRENVFDFDICSILLQNDSVAILWDGIRNNYIYSLKDHSLKKYNPETPLKSFLSFPVKSFTINAGSQGCFHYIRDKVNYIRLNDSIFTNLKISTITYDEFLDPSTTPEDTSTFKYYPTTSALTNLLTTINSNVSAMPSLKDFQITEQDKKNFLISVDERIKSEENEYVDGKKVNKEFYYSVVSALDTLGNDFISEFLNQTEDTYSTTSNWFTIEIINENNDTIKISREYYVSTLPWNLPWKFEYKGQQFNCYSIEFSKFIDSCIPDLFFDKEIFDNRALIMQIADYLWNKVE